MRKIFNPFILFLITALFTQTLLASPLSPKGDSPKERLQKNIRTILETRLKKSTVSIQIVSLGESGPEVVFEEGAGRLLNPASNIKLVTAAAALDALGPDYTLPTRFYADSVQEGWASNLWIKGYGDPLLITEEVSKIVLQLATLGLRGVQQNLLVDTSFFDRRSKMTYFSEASGRLYSVLTGALSFNFNRHFRHLNRGVALQKATTVGDEMNPAYDEEGSPLQNDLDPGLATGQVFKEALAKAGIPVLGEARLAVVPENAALLYEHRSPPLSEIIRKLNKFSNNFIAEQLVKILGAVKSSAPGTTANGLRVMEDYLAKIGIPPHSYIMENGSGLSLENRFSAAQLVQTLAHAYQNRDYGLSYISSLSIGGVDGTMKRRYRKSSLKGHVLAKTGSLAFVHCLSGYLVVENRPFAFSILVNDFQGPKGAVVGAEEKILQAVADYNRSL